ncbi:hypothetical protein EOL96_02820 [Candidatus Saccharibacteria bacterium]|nr:hypothetical protein [Candidatus Saccharibacteria bacterium]
MKNRIIIAALTFVGVLAFVAVQPVLVTNAIDITDCPSQNPDHCGLVNDDKLSTQVLNLVRTALIILGGVSVIMIIIGGIKYTISSGDSATLTSAKNTIIYSIVGLIVAMSATAIITLVINYFA